MVENAPPPPCPRCGGKLKIARGERMRLPVYSCEECGWSSDSRHEVAKRYIRERNEKS